MDAIAGRLRSLGAPPASLEACARLGRAPAVLAGQQPGVCLGPLYALHKACAAVALARKRGAAAVFWIAGDDHDLEEAARMEGLRAPVRAPQGTPLNLLETDEALRGWLKAQGLPAEDCRGTWSEWMARMLLRLLGDRGLVVVDPSWIRAESAPILARYAERWDALARTVADHSAKLEKRQVDPLPACHLFELVDGKRKRVERPDPAAVRAHPERFSPDVLLRPVVQDFVFRTAAIVAGPSEAAYLEQAVPLYEGLGVKRPEVILRPGVTILRPGDPRTLPVEPALVSRIEGLERKVLGELDALAAEAVALDPNLKRPSERTAEGIRQALGAFAGKVRAAGDRGGLLAWIRPGGKPQERVLNSGKVLARLGSGLVDALVERVDWTDPAPKVLEIPVP